MPTRTIEEAQNSPQAKLAQEILKTSAEIAKETAAAAVAEVTPPAPPTERPMPQVIQLTDVERIKAENLQLRMQLLESEYKSTKQSILDADKAWTASVSQRLGVDLTKYTLDFGNGTGLLVQVPDSLKKNAPGQGN